MTMLRLYRYYRRCGLPRRHSLVRALRAAWA